MDRNFWGEALVWFTDRSLARRVPAGLTEAGFRIAPYHEQAPLDNETPDHVWLDFVGYQGWVALSKDANVIRSRRPLDRLSRRVIVARRIPYFALSSGNLSADEMVECLHRARHRMEDLIRDPGPPFVARVYKNGAVRIVPNALESD